MALSQIQSHIEMIAKHEQDFLAQRTKPERIADAIAGFVGSLTFVGAHLCAFAFWIAFNLWPGTKHFDPHPFSLLQTIVAIESILVASFILIRQSRLGRRSDERDHLMLQILILTEKEITAVLDLERHVATQIGLGRAANQPDVRELSQETSIEDVAQNIKETME